ncbi:MAG: (2Fe-2S) ferredoxin domain-containing protein [Alphaproteobacteria bacterium]|nr:(2Fe-2S) ferredoxin domain-containing protein [Alphaproteobacteria bacterium]
MGYYEQHIFCCTNERKKDAPRGCCRSKGGEEIRAYLKDRVKELKLPKTRVNMSGCLDRCELGPVLVIYPQGTWYHVKNKKDAEEILQTHLIGGKVVERLALDDKQKRL